MQTIDVVCAAKNQKTSIISCFNVSSLEIFGGKNGRISRDAKRSCEEVFKCTVDVIKHKLLGLTVQDSKAVRDVEDKWKAIHWKAPHTLEFNWCNCTYLSSIVLSRLALGGIGSGYVLLGRRSDSVECWLYYGGVCSQSSDALFSLVVDPFNEAAAIEWCFNLMIRKCSYSGVDFKKWCPMQSQIDSGDIDELRPVFGVASIFALSLPRILAGQPQPDWDFNRPTSSRSNQHKRIPQTILPNVGYASTIASNNSGEGSSGVHNNGTLATYADLGCCNQRHRHCGAAF
ncbi:hypothetical protein Tco_0868054, partial [Tanacetum coccineum]